MVFKTCLLRRGFHTLIKGVLFSSTTNVGSHNPPPFGAKCPCWHTASCPPLQGPASSLTHHPVSGSNIICNDPSPPLADIVLFAPSLSGFPSRLMCLLKRDFHTLVKGVFRSPPQLMWDLTLTITAFQVLEEESNQSYFLSTLDVSCLSTRWYYGMRSVR